MSNHRKIRRSCILVREKKGLGGQKGIEAPALPEKSRERTGKMTCKSVEQEENHEKGQRWMGVLFGALFVMKPCHLARLLIVLCLCHAADAATNALDPAQLAYNLKTTVWSYEQSGRKNPKWDADAKKCLTLFAQIRSWTNGTPAELIQDLQTNVERVVAAQVFFCKMF